MFWPNFSATLDTFFILHVEHFSLDVKMKCNLKQ